MEINNAAFEDFMTELNEVGIETSDMSDDEKAQMFGVYKNVIGFLEDNKLVFSSENYEDINKATSALNNDITIVDIGSTEIYSLVDSCGVNSDYRVPCAQAVAHCIEKYKNENMATEHFAKTDSISSKAKMEGEVRDLGSIYSSELINTAYYEDPSEALEAFGVSSNNTIIDAKMAIAVTIMKFHKGIMPRFIPNRPTNSNVVLYDVERLELYDFNKSQSNSAAERYEGNHRIPFVELYGKPASANTEAEPIIVKESNDTADDFVFQDGYLHFNKQANMFDLAKDPLVPSYNNIDYTDLVSNGAKLDSIVARLQYDDGGGTTYDEYIEISVADRQGSRFIMTANASDASDRMCNLDFKYSIKDSEVKMDGTPSAIAALLDSNHVIDLDITANGKLNMKTSYINVLGSVVPSIKTLDGTTVISAMQDIFDDITFSVVAYSVSATYNEENLRKSSRSMRLMNKVIGYEIPGTKNVIVTHSLIQPRPDSVINALSNLLRVGNDDRGVQVIIDAMQNVYNRIQQEKTQDIPYDKKVMNEFVAGNKVLPFIYQDSININTEVQFMRSAEKLADVRGLAEQKLLEILTLIYNNSYYIQSLSAGMKPVFKVLTSGYIKDALLNVPYYTTIPDQPVSEKTGNSDVFEYKRMLSNGTELQIITSNFEYLADKMIIVPIIPSDSNSDLNFGHNWDRGSFVVSITAVMNRSGFKEIIANSREFPIITNPIGAYVTVNGLSNVFDGIGSLGI
jgi:hypothetical protein